MNIEFILQLFINGLFLGVFYATMALGFSTIWGVMRLINLAHGEFLMMGAFVAWFFFNPTREQSLEISVPNPDVTAVVFTLIAIFLGLVLSENTLKKYVENALYRRVGAVVAMLIVFAALYGLWSSNEFVALNLEMMTIIFVTLALSIGFGISHIILGTIMDWGTLWQRRGIAYLIGAIISYAGYSLWQNQGLPSIDPFLSLPIIFILFFAFGYILQNGFLNRLVEGPYLTMLLVTFALSIALQNIGLQIYAADPRLIDVSYRTGLKIFGNPNVTISPTRIFMTIVAVMMVAGLVAFLRYTRIGYAIRAASQNKMAARLMGINIKETYAITMAVSMALTGVAGAMMGTFQAITPVDGPEFTLRAFAIVALGGLGKVEGVVVGGLVLGLAESYVGGYISTGWAVTVAFLLLVVMLVIRPQGITGGLVSAEE